MKGREHAKRLTEGEFMQVKVKTLFTAMLRFIFIYFNMQIGPHRLLCIISLVTLIDLNLICVFPIIHCNAWLGVFDVCGGGECGVVVG